jgi:membrane-associated protease RseP (regulator of RpoE activity)
MKPLLSTRIVLLVCAIIFVALMLWIRAHPEKPEDPVMDAISQLSEGLGLDIDPIAGAKGGIAVKAVRPGSPADRLGLRAGDRILAIGDRSVWHALNVQEFLNQGLTSGRPFPILVDSNGDYHAIIMGRQMRGPGAQRPARGG